MLYPSCRSGPVHQHSSCSRPRACCALEMHTQGLLTRRTPRGIARACMKWRGTHLFLRTRRDRRTREQSLIVARHSARSKRD